jgi:DNA invertase Pin-like site-specific DNA recombinase
MSATIERIRQAARQRAEADDLKRRATADLREQAREAHAEGVSISQIAREAGLSRQGVYDLLAVQRPS